jgi:hypothetical protein
MMQPGTLPSFEALDLASQGPPAWALDFRALHAKLQGHLALLEQHIAAAEKRVARQREIVGCLSDDPDRITALELYATLTDILATMRSQHRAVTLELASLVAAAAQHP